MTRKNLERYLDRCRSNGEDPNPDYIKMYEKFDELREHRFDSEEQRENNLEWDMMNADWFVHKVCESNSYAQNLYAAMCNNEFQKLDVLPVLKEETWGCSWRSAGGIVAEIRKDGDYLDWYCSGIASKERCGYVGESIVTDEIREDLRQLGWIVLEER